MSGRAELLVSTGDEVRGCDIHCSHKPQLGKETAVRRFNTYIVDCINGVEMVVVSDAVPAGDVQLAPSDVLDGQVCGALA